MTAILLILHWASRIILSSIFLYSGYTKLQSTLQFAAAISGYNLLPHSLVLPLATYLPWVEIGLGILLLTGWKIRYFSMAAAGLLTAFIIIMVITYFRGIEADCGCFGFGDRISPLTISRDISFLVPALYLVNEARIRRSAGRRAIAQRAAAADS